MGLSYQLAEFVSKTEFEDIPASVIETQKKSVMDAIAITLGAATLGDGCREMVKLAEELASGGRPEATVIGFRKKLPAPWAAFANGSMAHSLDFGDTHSRSTIHSNSSSFPAALAVAEKLGNVDGKSFLTALVVGSEVACRIAMGADINTTSYGFYIPTIYSSFGAVAAVSKLLGLSPEETVNAFSFNLCQATCSSELLNNSDTVVRSVRESFTSKSAVLSCYMAKRGLKGFAEPLEGKNGFYHAYLRGEYTEPRVLDGLGRDFECEKLTFKAWPSCFGTHSCIDAALQLVKEHKIRPEEITRIHVKAAQLNRILLEPEEIRKAPTASIIAKFSIPFTVSEAIINGNVTLSSFSPEKYADPRILGLTHKFTHEICEGWGRGRETWSETTIFAERGVFGKMVTSPYGTPENPMDPEGMAAKMRACAASAVYPRSEDELESLELAVRNLQKLENISQLAELL